MSYRDDIDALTARHDALAHELEHTTRELDDARRLLDDAKARARLPVLDNIRVASPCKADWNAMTGDERVRHCGSCKKDVFNLTAMTRAEAETLIRTNNGGELCIRYFQRKDGTILLADCVIGARTRRRKLKLIAAGATALLAGGAAAGALLTRSHEKGEFLAGGAEYVHQEDTTLPAPPTPKTTPAPDLHDGEYIGGGSGYAPPPELTTTSGRR